MKQCIYLLLLGFFPLSALAMFEDDPWLLWVGSELEYFNEDGAGVLEWDTDIWYGRDLTKFWIKSSGHVEDADVEDSNLELVVSQATSAYWDRQFGLRVDFDPSDTDSQRYWASYGFIGTAPYLIEVDARLFVGEQGDAQFLLEAEREFMLTQRWMINAEIDLIANRRTNPEYKEGSGLSEAEISLQLGYEIDRKLAPYIGLRLEQRFGSNKRLARASGESSGDLALVAGLHFWF